MSATRIYSVTLLGCLLLSACVLPEESAAGAAPDSGTPTANAASRIPASPPMPRDPAVIAYERGVELARSNDNLAEAQIAFQQALQLNPNYAEAHLAQAQLWATRGLRPRTEIAAGIRTALRLKPDYAEAHYRLGQVLAETPGQLAEAREHLRQAIVGMPEAAGPALALGDLEMRLSGDFDEAVARYRQALKADPSRPDVRLKLALALLRLPATATTSDFSALPAGWSLDALGMFPRDRPELPLAGDAIRALAAADELEQAGTLHEKNPVYWSFVALVYIRGQDLAAAERATERVLALLPEESAGYRLRADIRWNQERVADALEDLKVASRLSPNEVRLAWMCGHLSLLQKDYAGAVRDFSRAIALRPGLPESFLGRATARLALNRLEEASRDASRAVELSAGLAEGWALRGEVRGRERRFADALQDFNRAILLVPNHTKFRVSRLSIRQEMRDWAGMVDDLDQLIALEPSAGNLRWRARIRMLQGDTRAALEDCARAQALAPRDAENFLASGLARTIAGDFHAALIDYEFALSLRPTQSAYIQFFRHLERRRLRLPSRPAEMEQVAAESAQEWTQTIARFLAGQMTEAAFLEAAVNSGEERKRERQCEACYYAGMMRLVDGDATGAKSLFAQSVATDGVRFFEYALAKGELARLR